ncbi:MAG: nucleotidyltransferase domain-containing protein [Bacteroidales bacterium]|nr:nucleotidyltransferase domain-containing protein [Bacteroidales bacterium]
MHNTTDLLRKLRLFKQPYSSEYGIERIGIFGSVARGEQTEQSDLDIYYEGKSLGLKSLVELPEKLEIFFCVPVDVVRKNNNLRPAFMNQIMRDRIAHGYFEIDADVVFDVLKVDMLPLFAAIKQIKIDLQQISPENF